MLMDETNELKQLYLGGLKKKSFISYKRRQPFIKESLAQYKKAKFYSTWSVD